MNTICKSAMITGFAFSASHSPRWPDLRCKWILRMHELVGDDLPLTQEFLAQMMGVQRTSVNGVASDLQKNGLISYKRGHIHIENIDRVRASACECHGTLRSHFEKIFGSASTAHALDPPRSSDSILSN